LSEDAANLEKTAARLEQLALKAVMLSEDDHLSLGAFLTDLDDLRKTLGDALSPAAADLLLQVEEVANRLVRHELPAAAPTVELLGLGISLLQQWFQKGSWSESGEEWRTYCTLLKDLGFDLPGPAEPTPSSQGAGRALADDPDLLAGFLAEALEHLEGIDTRLVHLEQHPHDLEAVNAIFRPFHTIKGVAGFLNLTPIQELGHAVEFLLDDVRSGQLPVSSDLVDTVLAGVDLLKAMLTDVQEALNGARSLGEFDLAPLQERIRALRAAASSSPPLEAAGKKEPLSPEKLAESQTPPSASPARPAEDTPGEEGNDRVMRPFSPLTSSSRAGGAAAVNATIKVDLAKVDLLADLMGELVIIQSQVRQNPALAAVTDQKLTRDLGQMARITSELQRISMSLRMVPISATFRKMVRLVRDLAHKVGKSVDLTLEGEDTEIDRNVVEAIYEPLVHLVRNAVDHGLETPAERQAKGKPPAGRLWIRAYQKGGNILIEIEDDGRGLDREAILARAREKGLVGPGDSLASPQVDHLIFEPGFSTACQVTEVSGRGVGLDVVKETVEGLRGKIDLASRPGEGCRFTLRLPLTLAIIDGLVVRVGQERYIIPAVGVRETVHPQARDYFTVAGQGELIRVRSQLIPLVRLHRLFGADHRDMPVTAGLALVVEHEGGLKALLVDEILGKQEVVIKSLGPLLQNAKGLAGGAILGDGRVGLILELGGVF